MTLRETLLAGLVIPAHPLALNRERKLDERRQLEHRMLERGRDQETQPPNPLLTPSNDTQD
jgi:hypothetical protein